MQGERYTRTAIWLHWLVAIGVIANIALAWIWPLGDSHPTIGEYVRPMIDTHKSIGLTVLGLAILRLLWRIGHRPPAFPPSYQPWERTLAHIVHWGLYFVIFAMPITGYVMDSAYEHAAATPLHLFGTIEFPRLGFVMNLPPDSKKWVHDTFGEAHELIAKLVYALVVLHLAGALKHQFQGQRELRRMGIGR
ncbi:MAG: cytochrome b [Sphingomonas sp.]|uniref:cytochrome b n=1 Tax=Sphingomonas sp. TaxID=28214 RepID=UPI001AC63D90|nr:cytochrome b [Sphingomonas sp.]MBN8809458.1 cytochrome b [Sphingomonas sp.]